MNKSYKENADLLLYARSLGVNYFDTAPGYGDSEAVLGQCLEDVDSPVILSTKLGGYPDPFEPQNKDHLRQSVKRSLQLLKRDTIDILMVHEALLPGTGHNLRVLG